jgi:hypothetical protein
MVIENNKNQEENIIYSYSILLKFAGHKKNSKTAIIAYAVEQKQGKETAISLAKRKINMWRCICSTNER